MKARQFIIKFKRSVKGSQQTTDQVVTAESETAAMISALYNMRDIEDGWRVDAMQELKG
jgi:hypothetical protein